MIATDKKTRRRNRCWKIFSIVLIPLIFAFATITVLRKPRSVSWADVNYSLAWETLTPGSVFAGEGLWFHTGWDGPTGEFSHGEIYAIMVGNKMLRFDIVDDPIAAIKKRLPYTVAGLLETFASKNFLEKRCAGEALINLGPAAHSALPVLLQRFGDGDRDAGFILELAKAARASAVPHLLEALEDAKPTIRLKAAHVLGEMGSDAKEAVPMLEMMSRSSDENQREVANRALEQIIRAKD